MCGLANACPLKRDTLDSGLCVRRRALGWAGLAGSPAAHGTSCAIPAKEPWPLVGYRAALGSGGRHRQANAAPLLPHSAGTGTWLVFDSTVAQRRALVPNVCIAVCMQWCATVATDTLGSTVHICVLRVTVSVRALTAGQGWVHPSIAVHTSPRLAAVTLHQPKIRPAYVNRSDQCD